MLLLENFISQYFKGDMATIIIPNGTTMLLPSSNKGVLSNLCSGLCAVHVEKTPFLSTKPLGKVDMQKSQNKMILAIMYNAQKKPRGTPQRRP